MTLQALAWLFTAGVVLHNAEEALFLPAWSSRRRGRWRPSVERGAFRFAVVVLTLLLVAIAAAASVAGADSPWAYLLAGYVFAMVANVFVPHVLGSVLLRSYVPGTATALAFNLPLGLLFLQRALAEGFVRWETLVWVAPATALALAALVPLLLLAGGQRAGGAGTHPRQPTRPR